MKLDWLDPLLLEIYTCSSYGRRTKTRFRLELQTFLRSLWARLTSVMQPEIVPSNAKRPADNMPPTRRQLGPSGGV